MNNVKAGLIASVLSLLVFYGKVNPAMQKRATEITQDLQKVIDVMDK